MMTSEELVAGYDILFSPELRLAHEAVLTVALLAQLPVSLLCTAATRWA